MSEAMIYPGNELLLFEKTIHWKGYFSKFILPFIGDKVLEVGVGLGANTVFLNHGSASTWVLLEPDSDMFKQLNNKLITGHLPENCRLVEGKLSDLPMDKQFDTIIYIDVLEHIENDLNELERAMQLLKPGGNIIILSPAFQSLYSPFDNAIGHFRRYTRKTLMASIPDGLKLVSLRYLDCLGFFLSLINRILMKKNYPTQQQVNFWDKCVIPVSGILDRIIFYSFGKTILGIWKKI